MNYKKYIAPALIAVVAFSLGRFATPAKVELREVEKIVYQQNESTEKDTNTVVTEKETRLPDGTIIKEKTKDQKTSTKTEKEIREDKERSLEKIVENRPGYRVGFGYEPAIVNFQPVRYTLMVERRIFSELYLGVSASSEKTFGLVVSLGF
jgi:hypothetical protein